RGRQRRERELHGRGRAGGADDRAAGDGRQGGDEHRHDDGDGGQRRAGGGRGRAVRDDGPAASHAVGRRVERPGRLDREVRVGLQLRRVVVRRGRGGGDGGVGEGGAGDADDRAAGDGRGRGGARRGDDRAGEQRGADGQRGREPDD